MKFSHSILFVLPLHFQHNGQYCNLPSFFTLKPTTGSLGFCPHVSVPLCKPTASCRSYCGSLFPVCLCFSSSCWSLGRGQDRGLCTHVGPSLDLLGGLRFNSGCSQASAPSFCCDSLMSLLWMILCTWLCYALNRVAIPAHIQTNPVHLSFSA